MKKVNIILIVLFLPFISLGQYPFKSVKEVSKTKSVILPKDFTYNVLFSEGDTISIRSYTTEPAKGNHDYIAFLQGENATTGKLYVGHESNTSSNLLGDGGGATIFGIEKTGNTWNAVGAKSNINFSEVGGTVSNCGGAVTAKNTILATEEFPPSSNKELFKNGKGFRDTSDYNGLKRYENMGWISEIDPISKKAISKLYKMGRYSHEGILIMPDNKTVFLTDDFLPSVFFKFVAQTENDFTDGQLYAYQQSKDGNTGDWITLPMDMPSLVNIRNVAIQKGATLFARAEWITSVDGLIYITETGADDFSLTEPISLGGIPAKHFENYKTKNGYDYPYGAVLVFDPKKNSIVPLVNGGKSKKDNSKHFSNPDAITFYKKDNKTFLVISEDIIGTNKGRVKDEDDKPTNEVWWLDLSIKNPTVEDLERFMVAPIGSESTGGCFSPDGSAFFINIQHPDKNNDPPFNKSVTIVVTGFK